MRYGAETSRIRSMNRLPALLWVPKESELRLRIQLCAADLMLVIRHIRGETLSGFLIWPGPVDCGNRFSSER